jgi:CDP-diacylglycerol--serine O-phosphatidyltransferase
MALGKLRLISIADILTMCNGACGILAIISFIVFYPNITIGTGLIFLGLVFDGMDGAAARKFGTKHDFGRHLDSISDSITFCLAPAVLVTAVFFNPVSSAPYLSLQTYTNPLNVIVLLSTILVIFFGWKRLIIFTVHGYNLKNFQGLATPALAFFIIVISHILDPHRPENDSILTAYFSLILIIIGSALMDTKINYPKIRGILGILLALAIILSLLSIEVQRWFNLSSTESLYDYYSVISLFGLGLIIIYVFISPFLLSLYYKDESMLK